MNEAEFRANLATLAEFPANLRRTLSGLDEAALRFRPAPGEWSATEVVGHLIDYEIITQSRIGLIISRDEPDLPALDPDGSVQKGDYQNKQVLALLHNYAERRAAFVEEMRFLRPAALERAGKHPKRGRMSIADIVAFTVWHDGNHAQQIASALELSRASQQQGSLTK